MIPAAMTRPEAPAFAAAPRERASPLLSALYLAVAALVLLRVGLIPLLLDLVIGYTSDAGSIVEKLHPTLYGFLGVGLVALLNFRIEFTPWERRVLRAMLAFLAGIVVLLVFASLAGGGGSAGFVIDTYATACCAAFLFLFPPRWRLKLGQAVLIWLALSAVVAIVEFVLKTRLLPFTETEYSFRPTGLAGHPLELALLTAMAIGFVTATAWSLRAKIGMTGLLLIGLAVSGARTALIVGGFSAFLIALVSVGRAASSRRRLEQRIVVVSMTIAAIPFLIGLLYAAGALDRFLGGGLTDANAQARVDIYRVFDYMTWQQLLFGMDPAGMRRIAKVYLDLEFVESSVVFFVTMFGAIGTAFFVLLLGWLLRVLLAGAKPGVVLAAIVFFLIALSSNGLSTKGASIFTLFTLIVAFRQPPARLGAPPAR